MKILLLGATGRTGQEVLAQALRATIAVHAVVRRPAAIPITSPYLTLFESPVIDEPVVREAMRGCEAVISTLNISRKSDFPWSGLRTPPHFLSDTLRAVLTIAQELAISRIILVTAWGVRETRPALPCWFRWLVEHSNLAPAYRDHERQEALLTASPCAWTIVRPVILTNSRRPALVRVSRPLEKPPHLFISRASLAGFLLKLYQSGDYQRELLTLSAT